MRSRNSFGGFYKMSKKNMVILDVGSEKLTILEGFRDVNNSICLTNKCEEYYEGFSDGEFLEPNNLEKAIFNVIKKAELSRGKKIKKISVSVPTEFCYSFCKNVSRSFLKPKKITNADINSLFSLANDFDKIKTHEVINQDYVYYVLGENNKVSNPKGQVETKITACLSFILAEKNFLNTFRSILKMAGVHKCRFISSNYAQMLYLFDDESRDKYVLLVDCGYITTSVCLCRGRGILNLSSFSLGGGHISADLSKCLKIPFSSAEILNKKIVLCVEPNNNDMYDLLVEGEILPISMKVANAIVESRIEVIAQGIQRCFGAWNYNFPEFIPVYLTGGGISFIKGARDLLGKELGKNVLDAKMPYFQLRKANYSSGMACLNYVLDNNVKYENIKKF